MIFNKSLNIVAVVLVALFWGVVGFEITNIIASDVLKAYRLAERADLDYEKTVQETATYIVTTTMRTGEIGMMQSIPSRELAINSIEVARKLKVDTGWFAPIFAISPEVNKAGIYITLLCIVVLSLKVLRDAQTEGRRSIQPTHSKLWGMTLPSPDKE